MTRCSVIMVSHQTGPVMFAAVNDATSLRHTRFKRDKSSQLSACALHAPNHGDCLQSLVKKCGASSPSKMRSMASSVNW